MAVVKIEINLAIPEDVYNNLPESKLRAFRREVRDLKKLSVRVNAGLDNEEMTVTATRHVCYHDEPGNSISCNDTRVEI